MQRTHNSYTSNFKMDMLKKYYEQSCPSIRKFCLENDIPKNTFYDWLSKYKSFSSHNDNNHSLSVISNNKSDYRKQFVDEYLKSNVTIKEFCIQNNLKKPTFYIWLRKYKNEVDVTNANEIIEITEPIKELANANNVESTFSLEIKGCKMTFNISDVKTVIKVLQE